MNEAFLSVSRLSLQTCGHRVVERSWTVGDFEGLGSDLLLTENVLSPLSDLPCSAAGSESIKMIHTYRIVLRLAFC